MFGEDKTLADRGKIVVPWSNEEAPERCTGTYGHQYPRQEHTTAAASNGCEPITRSRVVTITSVRCALSTSPPGRSLNGLLVSAQQLN